ncbi:T9SS type A sorting domain-containing protein [Chryseobacterium panacisoli]|uniref:T9SS type A sorting domain-containing protein n=1 Tax=Chryseobacterium panacisoli TaxID=1807141 RepID=A0A5D8ZJH8_9FLAO|nr:T9SS type A sorting domain-containing protein [Chryseobacterium panacisoli]TZF95145.1 T9SS type A sorting domain-containing protein [Chryseobacterium panacisoli]
MKKILFVCLLMISIVLSAQIKLGEGSTITGNAPVSSAFISYSQQIYTKQEINADAAGNITGLKFYVTPSANMGYAAQWDVYFGHTTKTTFVANDNWIPTGPMIKVYSGTVANTNGVIDITFTTPFPYDNAQNLVIGVHQKMFNDIPPNQFFVYNTIEGGMVFTNSPVYSGDPSTSPNGTLLPYKPVVSLNGLVASTLPVCPVVSYPFNNAILVPPSPAITWAASPGATDYKVSIGTTPGGTDVVNQQSVATTSFTPSSPLSVYTTYYLNVKAVGVTGESSGCVNIKFTTGALQPSNDECTNAVDLVVSPTIDCTNLTSGTNLMATVSNQGQNSCITSYSHNDVWYKFTAIASKHMIKLSNITSVGAVNNKFIYFSVFKGSCGNLTNIACSDEAQYYSIVSNLTPGETYYVKVYTRANYGAAQNFDICVVTFPPPPVNDECGSAIDLPVNPDLNCASITQGTIISATDSSLSPATCYNSPYYDVWFKFTATGNKHVIKLSNIIYKVPVFFAPTLRFQVYKGGCNSLVSLSCSYLNALAVDNLTVGDTYYIRVYSSLTGQSSAMDFDICIGTDNTPPPPNDECINAVTLPVNSDLNCAVVTAGSTVGATASNISAPTCNGVAKPGDVWFKFTATATGHLIQLKDLVSLGVQSGTETYFQLFSGDCGNLTNIKCSHLMGGVSGLTIGQTYYIRVFNTRYPSEVVGFNICIGTLPPVPVNDSCSGALVASVFPYSYTQTDALAATNNNGFVTACSPAMNDGTWFTFTGDGSTHKIIVTPTGNGFPRVGVYKGGCGSLTCITRGWHSTPISIDTVPGTVYYVNVGDESSTVDYLEFPFTITISKGTLGVSEVSKNGESIEAYPNPFTDILNISKHGKVKSVSILDSSGRLVKTIDNPSSMLHLGDLKQGMYLVVLNMKDGSKQTIKAIKR